MKDNKQAFWEKLISIEVSDETKKKMLEDKETRDVVKKVFGAIWTIQDTIDEKQKD